MRLLLSLLCAVCLAQAQSSETPNFHSETSLVDLDLVAVDSHGQHISDLNSQDLRLYVDNALHPITSFTLEHTRSVPTSVASVRPLLVEQKSLSVFANFSAHS